MGTKRSVLTDENGLPLAVVLSGANTHDVKLLEDTLDHIVVLRPEADEEHPQNLCLDAGYLPAGNYDPLPGSAWPYPEYPYPSGQKDEKGREVSHVFQHR